MTGYARPHVRRIIEKLQDPTSRRILAVTGPRQTGKTTIARQVGSALIAGGHQCWYVPLDDPTPPDSYSKEGSTGPDAVPMEAAPDRQWLTELWESARREALRGEKDLILVLDEIQSVAGWSRTVKGLWDRDQRIQCPLRVVILGSAPWQLLTGLSESLAGRHYPIPVTHWSHQEMTAAFGLTLEQYIFFGGYPGAMTSGPDGHSDWQNYVGGSIIEPAMNRDIIGLTRIDSPEMLRQLIRLTPQYSGRIMSLNKLRGRLSGSHSAITRYLNLIGDAGLVAALDRYTPSPHTGKASAPKLIALNTALITVESGYTFEQAQVDRSYWGRLVESTAGAHLYNTRQRGTELKFWRKNPHEVDFVLVRGPQLLGIEVKSGKPRGHSGLSAFAERFGHAKTAVVGNGGIPLREFLSHNADYWLDQT
ncbi:MAG: ATP-binding protein [Bacteroidota bacterium]|nr:ATP-binding protein [Bacteroidota bacterium]